MLPISQGDQSTNASVDCAGHRSPRATKSPRLSICYGFDQNRAAPNLDWVAVSPLLGGANSNNVAIGLEVAPVAGPAVGCGQLDFGFCRRSEIDVTNSERVGSRFLSLRQVDPPQVSPRGRWPSKKPLFGKVLRETSAPRTPDPGQIAFSRPHILQTLGLRPKSAEVCILMGSGLNQREAWILTPVRRASVWTPLRS